MALGSCACRSPCINTPANPARELNEFAGAQGPTRRSKAGSNKAPTEALTPPEALTLSLIPLSMKDLFTRFMKVIMETTQAQALAEQQERPLKARTAEIYSEKSHMDCYHFCQQCEDYFETSGATGINCTPFTAPFFRSIVSLRWAQHKRCHKSVTPLTWPEFKNFL